MKRRSVLLLTAYMALASLVPTIRASAVAARSDDDDDTYVIEFSFEGLISFVPFDRSGSTATRLWVLVPGMNRPEETMAMLNKDDLVREKRRFGPRDGAYPPHHAFLYLPGPQIADLGGGITSLLLPVDPPVGDEGTQLDGYDVELGGISETADDRVRLQNFDDLPAIKDGPDVAHACEGCVGKDWMTPETLPGGATVPIGMRLLFRHGETVKVVPNKVFNWRYSEGDATIRPLPARVTVTSRKLSGPTTLIVRHRNAGIPPLVFHITPPPPGIPVQFAVANAPLSELFEGDAVVKRGARPPKEVHLDHFKLGFLLAPKESTSGHRYAYDYKHYPYVVALRAAPIAGVHTDADPRNLDPFCTSSSRMQP